MLDPYIVTIGAKIATYFVGSQARRQIQILLKVPGTSLTLMKTVQPASVQGAHHTPQ